MLQSFTAAMWTVSDGGRRWIFHIGVRQPPAKRRRRRERRPLAPRHPGHPAGSLSLPNVGASRFPPKRELELAIGPPRDEAAKQPIRASLVPEDTVRPPSEQISPIGHS